MNRIAISTKSWHYSLYCWVRDFWGFPVESDGFRTSLCPYCHTLLWGSLFAVVLSPLILVGWVLKKASEAIYTSQNRRLEAMCNWLDNKTTIKQHVREVENIFNESPIVGGIAYIVFAIVAAFVVLLIVGIPLAFIYGIGFGLWNIVDIGAFIIDKTMLAGYYVFMGAAFLGLMLEFTASKVAWFFTNGPLWSAVAQWVAWIAVMALAVGIHSMAVGYLIMRIKNSAWFSRIKKSRSEKTNKRRAARREELDFDQLAFQALRWECEFCNYENKHMSGNSIRKYCCNCEIRRSFPPNPLLKFLVESTPLKQIIAFLKKERTATIKVNNQKVKVLSTFSIIWAFIKALKARACPIVEVISPEKLQAEAIMAGVVRTEKEKVLEQTSDAELG